MQKVHNRKGYALGAIVALLASLFGALPASAAATDGANIGLRPQAGTATNFTGLLTEDFALEAQLLEGITSNNFTEGKLRWQVTKVSGPYDFVIVSSETNSAGTEVANNGVATGSDITPLSGAAKAISHSAIVAGTATATLTAVGDIKDSTSVSYAYLRAVSTSGQGIVRTSSDAVFTVTVFIDNQGGSANGVRDADEWYTTKTVTLKGANNVTSNIALTAPTPGDTVVTASATITLLNVANLNGGFYLAVESSPDSFERDAGSAGAYSTSTVSAGLDLQNTQSGAIGYAWSTYTAVSQSVTVSAHLRYYASGTHDGSASFSDGVRVGALVTASSGLNGATGLDVSISAASYDDITESSGIFTARANKTYTFRIAAISGSGKVASTAVTAALTSSVGLTAGLKYLVVNGTTTTSWPSALALTTGTDGYATLTVTTVGFADGNDFWVSATKQALSDAMKVEVEVANYALTQPFSNYKTAAGTAATLQYEVADQWKVAPIAADQLRVMVVKGGHASFSYTTTVSYATVTNGTAEFSFLPEPATVTASATATVDLQKYNASTGAWANTSDQVTTNINVSGLADDFDAAVATSYSVSVSYFPNTTAWVVVSGKVDNTGSAIVVTGAGLYFSNSSGVTYSGGITVRADSSRAYSFGVAGELVGSYTITMTNGSATTTSLIKVDPVTGSAGSAINFDISSITAGTTKILVGTVVDANGNPVDTSVGSAAILVSYAANAGIPVGTVPTETDANGEFKLSILTTEKDAGTFTVTAVYLKDGASTAAADKITKVHAVTIGDATTPSADQKVNAGSFKGYVAVYAKGYAGKRMSAKIGNDWVVVESLASNFERVVDFTGAGYTIAVRIYIDRVLVDTITVTTK